MGPQWSLLGFEHWGSFLRSVLFMKAGRPTMADINTLFAQIQSLTLREAVQLGKHVEETLCAPAPLYIGFPIGDPAPPLMETEPPEFSILLLDPGDRRLNVIQVVHRVTTLRITDAKALVEHPPQIVRSGLRKTEAEKIYRQFRDEGATVELRQAPMVAEAARDREQRLAE